MHVLILGGTQFVGRHIVEALLVAGHKVSILTRGHSPDPLPAHVERLRGDRDLGKRGIAALAGRRWDVCVDVSGYTPRQVRPSAEQLREHIGRYVYVSAVSVYGNPDERPVLETQPRIAPADEDVTEVVGEAYGALKVACENVVCDVYGDRCALLRPQVVVGPYDQSGRYDYWVQRADRSGPMLASGNGSDHLQVIDARDLARFVVTVIECRLNGAYNLAGPRITWAEFMRLLGAQDIVWVPAAILAASGLTFNERLPLFRPERGPRSSLMDVSNDKALRAGLALTDPSDTLRDTRAWLTGREWSAVFMPEIEVQLIEAARRGLA